MSGTEAMIDFINRGNIRIMPEVGGVELSAVPTKAQKEALDSFISKNRGEITLDISDENGDNLLSIEYPRGTFSKKIFNDIEQYFENGTEPLFQIPPVFATLYWIETIFKKRSTSGKDKYSTPPLTH